LKSKSSKIEFYLPLITILFDASCIVLTYYLAYQIRFYSPFVKIVPLVVTTIPDIRGYLFFGIVTIPVWIIVFQASKMYRLNRNVFIFDEFFVIVKCVTISLLLSIGVIFFFREFPYSRIVFMLLWVVSIIIFTLSRYILLKFEKTLYNNEIGVKNIVILGSNEMAERMYDKFTRDKFAGFKVVGFISKTKPPDLNETGRVYLGGYENIKEIIEENNLDKILISLTYQESEDLYSIMSQCEGINIEFLSVPHYIGIITSKLRVVEIDGIPFMKLKSVPMNVWNRIVKRIFDIFFSMAFLIIFSPVFVFIAILIKLDTKGSVFYKQERVGLDGKKFMLIKFRSMRVDAEKAGPRFSSTDDERHTKTGKYLRKYSIDELPQFLNVLYGNMSIVGPRPEREYFIVKLKDSIQRYMERHRVKCGITGWAQVNGYRGSNTSIQTRVDYDIYYIENWSLVFDLKIIIKTLKEVFFSKNAF
jgi:exopolysaccharide biosynthesis polyprenyl glycosylphosphotransferase